MEEIAKLLLGIKAVSLSPSKPFTYASGLKGPIYCDNRLIISYPDKRKEIIEGFLNLIKKNNLNCDVVAGVATGAIATAALIADKLKKPMVYIRAKTKSHGKGNKIEGKLEKGQKVLVIEDLINTGGSSISAINTVKEAGCKVVACIAIFTYGLELAHQKFKDANCRLFTLSNLDALLKAAAKTGYVNEGEKQSILEWQKDPKNWKK